MEGQYVIVEEEARWVREIFARCAAGASLNSICRWLEEERVPTHMGAKHWYAGSLTGIIKNPVHKGKPTYGKTERLTDEARLEKGFKRTNYKRKLAEARWTLTAPAIVDEATWNACQERLAENPYFEVNAPLLSRSRLFRLERLSDDAIRALLERALTNAERGLGALNVIADEEAVEHLIHIAGGDARNALNALEAAAQAAVPDAEGWGHLTLALAEEGAQARALGYDKQGDEHYDTISAFIKSVRGSDPDAALYWLAKMLLAGEDIRFIARRLVILASEDIGNADPMGLVIANAAAQAVMFVGMPEAQLILSQAVTYLAAAPKSNAATIAIGRAMEEIQTNGAQPVPLPLRDAHYPGGKTLGHGGGYLYPHDFPGHYVEQEYLSPDAQGRPFYEPTEEGQEATIKQRMEARKSAQERG